MKYRILGGKLEYKDADGEWKGCICPFREDAECELACPHFRKESADASGHVRAFISCGSVRELVLA